MDRTIVGFTGTQVGMSIDQKKRLGELLAEIGAVEFHHGDCIGADAEADWIARVPHRCHIVIHPPTDSSKRAFTARPGDMVHQPRPYLVRNHQIVLSSGLLIAAPRTDREELRSGTWATVRYARTIGREVILLPRSGPVRTGA